jgi:hypothetical protein
LNSLVGLQVHEATSVRGSEDDTTLVALQILKGATELSRALEAEAELAAVSRNSSRDFAIG